jgi:hypothetical protein
VLLKFALIAGLAKLFGSSDGVSMRTGLGWRRRANSASCC